jgi:hypothetical protein
MDSPHIARPDRRLISVLAMQLSAHSVLERLADGIGLDADLALFVDKLGTKAMEKSAGSIDRIRCRTEPDTERRPIDSLPAAVAVRTNGAARVVADEGFAWQLRVWDRMANIYRREIDTRFGPVIEQVLKRADLRPGVTSFTDASRSNRDDVDLQSERLQA